MMDFVAGCFALVVVLAVVGGTVGTIAPGIFRFGKPERPSRKRIACVSLAVFIAAFFGFALTVPPTPEQKAKAAAETRVEAAKQVAADKDRKAQAANKKANEQAALRHEVEGLWNKIADIDKLCSDGARAVGDIDSADLYSAYGRAQDAMQACKVAHYALRELEAPQSLAGEHQDNFESAIDKCADSSLARQLMFEKMLTVIDGDMRPSSVQAVKDASETAKVAGFQCVGGFVHAANEVGVAVSDYVKENARK